MTGRAAAHLAGLHAQGVGAREADGPRAHLLQGPCASGGRRPSVTALRARSWMPVAAAAGAALAVAGLGAAVTDLGPWYQELRQPAWKPPDWLFGPAWTLIFALAALAGVEAWRHARAPAERARIILLFAINGVLNVLWSGLFFRLPPSGLGACGGWISLAIDRRADCRARTTLENSELAPGAVSRMGHLRRTPEPGGRPAKLTVRVTPTREQSSYSRPGASSTSFSVDGSGGGRSRRLPRRPVGAWLPSMC